MVGVFAIGAALIPMGWNGVDASGFSMHGASAILMFLCIAYACLFCRFESLSQMDNEEVKEKFIRLYRVIGVFVIVSPAVAWLFTIVFDQFNSYVFFAEMFGIWVFAIYWWAKSKELAMSNAENRALSGTYT